MILTNEDISNGNSVFLDGTYLFEDFLRRVLIYLGYQVNHVMNMTDVGHLSGDQDFGDDKMEKEGGSAEEIMTLARKYTDAFLRDIMPDFPRP